jgi:hypothetical protein
MPLSTDRGPDICIDSAGGIVRLLNRLALGCSGLLGGFPLFHIKYEDLTNGKFDFRALEFRLGMESKEDTALSAPVGVTAKCGRINWYEHLFIALPGLRIKC